MKILSQLLLALIFSSALLGQNTIVKGRVFDVNTNEPLPFISIVFKGLKGGTTTDFDGHFQLITDQKTDSIIFTYLGYQRKAMKVQALSTQELNVLLEPSTISLMEIVIRPGENPAHRIIKNLIENKYKNDIERLDAYQYEVYSKYEVDINNISDKFKKRKVMKPFDFIFNNIDSTAKNEKPFLPMFISETVSDYFYRKNPKARKEVIKATKVAGVQDASVSQAMGNMNYYTDVYDNAFLLFGKKFASPISDNAFYFYKFFLIDSVYIGNHYCYQIQFKPKRKEELTFTGNIWINDSTWAVKRFEMSVSKDANINFINAFTFIQEFEFVKGAWMLSKDKMVVDVALREKQMGAYLRKTTSYKDFVINQNFDDKFFRGGEKTIVLDGAENKSSNYWQQNRHDTLSRNEEVVYKMVDTIQTLRRFRWMRDIGQTFYTGYYVFKKFEYGPYFTTYSFNQVEGSRVRLGGRSSNAFSKWIELSGYGAYGFLDQKYKYSLSVRGFLKKKPTRRMYSVTYKHDYEVLGQSINAFKQDNIMASLFRRNPLSNLTEVDKLYGYYDHEWFSGFNSRINLSYRTIRPLGTTQYIYEVKGKNIVQENIKTAEVGIWTRFAWNEKFINGEYERISLGTTYPILQASYNVNLKGVLGSNYHYHKATFSVSDRYRQNPIGYIDYLVEVGKYWGTVPYPLLELHPGNETYAYDPFSFNLMNYFEFASDKYLVLTATHHFDGFFLNKIPLMKKLKWRELISVKSVWGDITNANKQMLKMPVTLTSLRTKPYVEFGIGIENILKVLRLDAMWRLTYINNSYVQYYEQYSKSKISKFGIRATFQFGF